MNNLTKRILSSIILIPLTFYLVFQGSIIFNIFLSICFLITAYEWYKMTFKKKYKFLGLLYLTLSFYLIYKFRNEFDENYLYFLLILLVCISTDIGGYIFGKIFKGPKLTKISPKKTYAGMIGAYLMSIITLIFFTETLIITLDVIIFVILVSSISQLGDIVISYFKRHCKIKDSGSIIPGHGGLLDRIDGMLFAFPFSYLILLTDFTI